MDLLETKRLALLSVTENELKEQGFLYIAGVDEAGRGPLAGPVVAAACILLDGVVFKHLNDSKKLSAEIREDLFEEMSASKQVVFSVGMIDVNTIDQINILQATFRAMQKAVETLARQPDYLLIDGNQLPCFDIPSRTLVKGDRLSVSIAAASIFAKVTRDRLMQEWDQKYPEYGFKQHKGYATEQHISAIYKYGPTPIHRKTFDPIRSLLNAEQTMLF